MPLTIALAQIDPCVGDLAANAALVFDSVREAAAGGAHVVVAPEMALTGYPIEDLALRRSFREAAEDALTNLATGLAEANLGHITVIVGTLGTTPDSENRGADGVSRDSDPAEGHPPRGLGRPTNVAAVIREGKVVASYAKMNLPNYGVFDEYRIFAPGTEPCVVSAGGYRLLLAICEDIWRPCPPPVQALAGQVDAVIVLNGSPFEVGKSDVRRQHAAAWAHALDAPVAYVNLLGGQDDLVFDGGSFALDAGGRLALSAGQFTEELVYLQLDHDGGPCTIEPGPQALVQDQSAQMYQALVLGLRDYCAKNGFTSVVLGLSGGIDSALVAAIACDAVGAANVTAVSMPSMFSSQGSKDDAAQLAANTGLDFRIQPITPLIDAFAAELPLTGIAAENLQARMRGVILMGISNQENKLVLAPGNKSELAAGYSTIYGDAVGGFAPIKDVFKTEVWALARWRNAQATDLGLTPPIPTASIDKPPSAELRPGQVDTDSLPEYELLDQVLEAYVGRAHGRRELLAAGFDPDTIDLVLRLVDRAEWKRRQYPPGPKVSALAFGRDRRLPITSRWREE